MPRRYPSACMSVHESLRVYYPVDLNRYLQALIAEFGASPHPSLPGVLLVGLPSLPVFAPRHLDNQLSVLSFNYLPIPHAIIQALVKHPALVPPDTPVRWTLEQDLVFAGTLRQLQKRMA
jgi:hypothetical protein